MAGSTGIGDREDAAAVGEEGFGFEPSGAWGSVGPAEARVRRPVPGLRLPQTIEALNALGRAWN